jgi:hypothetical protein
VIHRHRWFWTVLAFGCAAGLIGSHARGLTKETVHPRVVYAVAPSFFPDTLRFDSDRGGASVVVEAMVAPDGAVAWANVVHSEWFSFVWYDKFVTLARRWRFAPVDSDVRDRGYKVEIAFVFTLLPHDADFEDVVTVFSAPATIETRARISAPVQNGAGWIGVCVLTKPPAHVSH